MSSSPVQPSRTGHPFPFRHLKYPEAGHTILVPYWPLPELRVLTLARVEGEQEYLLFQGGTAKADAEAGIDAWRELLAFLDDARPRREPRLLDNA